MSDLPSFLSMRHNRNNDHDSNALLFWDRANFLTIEPYSLNFTCETIGAMLTVMLLIFVGTHLLPSEILLPLAI